MEACAMHCGVDAPVHTQFDGLTGSICGLDHDWIAKIIDAWTHLQAVSDESKSTLRHTSVHTNIKNMLVTGGRHHVMCMFLEHCCSEQ